MLRFRLHQLYLSRPARFFLPLPKLGGEQLGALAGDLGSRGFAVSKGSTSGRLLVARGRKRITVDGGLGLASSSEDMLDAIGPSIPSLLGSPASTQEAAWIGARYFSVKRGAGGSKQLQLFPRMESLRMWDYLRMEGVSGLTPDEAAVLRHLLRAAPRSQIECVSTRPAEGSRALQEGKRLYYESKVTVQEFLSSLGTVESERLDSASFVPRDSILELGRTEVDTAITPEEVGEWCQVAPLPRNI